MGIKQLYNDNLRTLPNEYGDVSVMDFPKVNPLAMPQFDPFRVFLFIYLFIYFLSLRTLGCFKQVRGGFLISRIKH